MHLYQITDVHQDVYYLPAESIPHAASKFEKHIKTKPEKIELWATSKAMTTKERYERGVHFRGPWFIANDED